MKTSHLIFLSLLLSIFMGCVTNSSRHPEFTSKNVFDLRPGMTQKEIEDRFGLPDRTSEITLGTKAPDPWPALIYYYDIRKDQIEKYKHIVYSNKFYFVLDIQPPLLRSWELELVRPEKIN